MKKRYFLSFLLVSFILVLYSCKSTGPANMDNQNKDIAIKAMNAWQNNDAAMLDSLVAPDFVEYQLDTVHSKATGMAAVKEDMQMMHKALPDMKTTIHAVAVAGDTVMIYNTTSGTMSDSMMGMPPTNKMMTMNGVDVFLVQNGKIAAHWGFLDPASMAQFAPPQPMQKEMHGKMKKMK
jgi:steroid delta-isomerase-like uncharacterized protein